MDIKEIKEIINFLSQTDVEELKIEKEGIRVEIRRSSRKEAVSTESQIASVDKRGDGKEEHALVDEGSSEEATNYKTVVSPLVGTFYRSSTPDGKPLIEEGSVVEKGDVICIIEAMKVMNEIEAEFRGRVVSIFLENGQSTEYGQTLFLIEPLP